MSSYAAEGTPDAEVAGDPAPAAGEEAAPEPASDDAPARPTASDSGPDAGQDTAPGDQDIAYENNHFDEKTSETDATEGNTPENDTYEGDEAPAAHDDNYDGPDYDGPDYDGGDYNHRGYDDDEPPYEQPKVSKLAIVALITGVIPLVPVALSTGSAARVGIRRSGRRGQGMAVSALFFACGWMVVAGGLGAIAHFTHLFQKQVNVVYVYKEASVFKLKKGECINTSNGRQVTIVSCASPHDAEVFGTFSLPAGNWPGTSAVRRESSSGCASRLTHYINPQLTINLVQTYVYPTQADWTAGTRTVVCEVHGTAGQLTQSVRASS